MNRKGSLMVGSAIVIVVFLLMITAFATIEPLKESLDVARNGTSLNCPGTSGFDLSDFEDDTDFEKRVRRPTCFVTGISMVWFIGGFVIAAIVWGYRQWLKG